MGQDLRAGVYLRVSKAATGDLLAFERQEPVCRTLVEQLHGEVVEVYQDHNRSAFDRRKVRDDFERMVRDAKSGHINALVTLADDRFARNERDALVLLDLADQYGVRLITNSEEWNLRTASGRRDFRTAMNHAIFESERRSERLKAKHEQLATKGRPHGGRRPFGFGANGLDHDQAEAEAIREAAARLIAGEPTYAVLRDWHDRGITTPGGYRWHATSFRHVLVSPRIAGLREHRGAIVGPAAWKPIIDEATWRQVKDVFADPERRRRQGPSRRYLLTGLGIVCGWPECGKPLIARPAVKADGRSIRQYVCSGPPRGRGCGKLTQYAEPLELYVAERMLDWLAGPGLAAMLAARAADDVDYAALGRERDAADRKLDQLSDWLTDGTLDQPRYLRQKRRV